ncbi:tetratricopeptide repeat protein [Erythrobacter sp. NE805]|uniref:tetratricopeptide repeat protein n=1 Tax=Erythrobacter sp. NE805 TaxID=3389875 RepID=UPI00396B2140
MIVTALALALVTPAPSAPAHAAAMAEAPELAANTLAAGRSSEALATLERASLSDPHDPAVLINLGIAYAHAGEEAKARAAFARALACQEVVELDTADGTTTDSRKLARKAMRMLERGEFRSTGLRAGQLTYRD